MLEKFNYKNLFTKANLFVAIFGILPPAGYLIGVSFYQGRLSAYGVGSDAFPLALQDIYVEAFWAISLWLTTMAKGIMSIFRTVFTPPGLYWLILTALVITLILYVLIKYKLSLGSFLRKKLHPLKRLIDYLDSDKNAFTKAVGLTGGISYLLVVGLWLLLILFLCWVGLPIAAYHTGRDSASITINTYLEKGCFVKNGERWGNCKALKAADGKLVYEGILVAHTNGYIAFFNKGGSFVARFPDDWVIESKLH